MPTVQIKLEIFRATLWHAEGPATGTAGIHVGAHDAIHVYKNDVDSIDTCVRL